MFSLSPITHAQPELGDQFQVNELTLLRERWPAVTQTPTGDFIVAWQFQFNAIIARKFEQGGSPLTGEIFVNDGGDIDTQATIASAADGSFVVSWKHTDDASQVESIFLRRYDPTGAPLGPEFAVPDGTGGYRAPPEIAMAGDGRFIVVWQGYSPPGDDTSSGSIKGQLFDAGGGPEGSEFQVNTTTLGYQYYPSVSMANDGSFIVAWTSNSSSFPDPPEPEIRARRFDALGLPLAADFQVNSYVTSTQTDTDIAIEPGGRFIVVWTSDGSAADDDSSTSVQARRYDAFGLPLGDQFQVNSHTTSSQRSPEVSISESGFVVTWASSSSPGDDPYASIVARAFDAAGDPDGSDFQVNTYTLSYQEYPDVAASSAGDFVIVWHSSGSPGDDNDYESIQARPSVRSLLFVDGFESGDTAAWSATVP